MALGIVERDALRAGARAAIRGVLDKAEGIYVQKFETPTITFDKRGKIAATAASGTWVININEPLYHLNITDFLSETLPHEVAHLVANRVAGRSCKHDEFWCAVATSLGCTRTNLRYNSYDVSTTRIKQRRWRYICPRCQKDNFNLSTVLHNRHQRGTRYRGCANNHEWVRIIFTEEIK